MDYIEPSMEIISFNVEEDMVRTSGLGTGDEFKDQSGFGGL